MHRAHRLWAVDTARGIAILMMVLSNFLFDLSLFAGCSGCYEGFWLYFARATAALFILLVGVSLTLSYSRSREKGAVPFKKYLLRGARIFFYGLLITAVTWLFLPNSFIVFGILHLIGISIILSYPFLRKRELTLIFGIIVIVIGFLLENIFVSFPWLVWAGLKYPGFFSVDYTPLFPWLGVALLGVFLGNLFFPQGKQRFALRDFSNSLGIKVLTKLGRNSLFIYLVHQPILVGLLFLYLGKIPF